MKKMILSEKEIGEICSSLAAKMSDDLKNEEKPPLFLGVMKGALPFFHDLVKRITIPMFLDYIQVSSYEGTETTGKVTLKKDLTYDVKGRTIVIVEDIIDTGYSMHYLLEHLKEKYQPKQVLVCALFDKSCRREIPVQIDYFGKVIGNEFIVGYGLDYNEYFRNIPYVYVPTEEEIASCK